MAVIFWRDNTVFFVQLTNPPVNAINLQTRRELIKAIKTGERERDIDRIILLGDKKIFSAGGDANEFDLPPEPPHLPGILKQIENSKTPWIAAIDGPAFGGGLELAMACHYRIATVRSSLGLPEVTLGIVPGAGGTQRLPRLIGFLKSLEMIVGGKKVSANQALEDGLLDEISNKPIEKAQRLCLQELRKNVPVSRMKNPKLDASALKKIECYIEKKNQGQIAPKKAIELVCLSCKADFQSGVIAERKIFLNLRQSPQAKALRHLFFTERKTKPPTCISKITVDTPNQVVVVGGGIMGTGIAYAFLQAGLPVTIIEANERSVQKAIKSGESLTQKSVAQGHISADQAKEMYDSLEVTSNYNAAKKADLAIEAVSEDIELKINVFRKLETVMAKDAILATNTSYLDINQIADALNNPRRLIGLHFFVPAHIMKLLEIIRGHQSSKKALATGYVVAKVLKKTPVLSGVCEGFIGNRILSSQREAADTLLLTGSTPSEVDKAMENFGYKIGPYKAQDMSGLDIAFANRRRKDETRDPNRRYVEIADKLVQSGRLGRKTNAGWYSYSEEGIPRYDKFVDKIILAESENASITRRTFTMDEIQRRLILSMINEAAKILSEKIAQSTLDIDLVTVLGYGFPRWRGGLMHHANNIGWKYIFESLEKLCREDEIFWKPSDFILHLSKDEK